MRTITNLIKRAATSVTRNLENVDVKMNDFTLEELKQIYSHMENEPRELMDKIKSMIDNYCEHEWQEIFNERTYSRCNKCGEEGI